jgi:hypothetical protein
MNHDQQPSFDLGAIVGAYIGTLIFIWVVCAIVAAGVAPRGRQGEFFLLTLFFLGPLGVGFAAVATPRETSMPGRARFVCPRCSAAQFVEYDVDEFDCWRCDQRVDIEYRRFGGPRVQAAAKSKATLGVTPVVGKTTSVEAAPEPKVAPRATPVVAKRVTVKCHKCGHIQTVPASATSFHCNNCNASLKRKTS